MAIESSMVLPSLPVLHCVKSRYSRTASQSSPWTSGLPAVPVHFPVCWCFPDSETRPYLITPRLT